MNRRDVSKFDHNDWPMSYLSPSIIESPAGDDALMDRVESVGILGNEDLLASERPSILRPLRGRAGVVG